MLQFRGLIRVLELISVQNQSRDSFILIKFNTLSIWGEVVSVHWSLWCNSLSWTYPNDLRWIPVISGIDWDSVAHFRSESLQRFIYFNKIQHIVLVEGDC